MKLLIWLLVLPIVALAKPSQVASSAKESKQAKDEIVRLVDDEFSKETTSVRTEWEQLAKKLAEINGRREKAVEESRARGQWEAQGAELMQKFQTVVNSRYHGKTGEFEGGRELSQHDLDNINKVFNRYLSSTPLKGRVSTGEAVRFLDWGAKRLNTLSNSHNEPSEANNSELEILAYQNKTAAGEQARLVEIGKMVGLDFNESAATAPKRQTAKIPKITEAAETYVPAAKPVGSFLPPPTEAASVAAEDSEEEAPPVRKPASKKKKGSSLLPDF